MALAAHIRLDLVKIWSASAPSAKPRSKARCRPPAVDSCAPSSKLFAGDAAADALVPAGDEVLEGVVEPVVHRVHDHHAELGGRQPQRLVVLLAVMAVDDHRHVALPDQHE